MQQLIPKYNPPSRPKERLGSWPEYWARLEDWLDRYAKYNQDYQTQVQAVVNTGTQGFPRANVASASTVDVVAYISDVTGTTPIQTIKTTPGHSGQIALVSINGFSVTTGGNIASSQAVPAGTVALLNYDPVTTKWYPTQSGVPGPAGPTGPTGPAGPTLWLRFFMVMGA